MVWMNSASSLKYPTVFTGAERVVELTGEAYFEVAANAKMPFKVNTRQVTVDVLGTEFNIHAYPDEPSVTTTLVEGSVRVSNQVQAGGRSAVLTPGWQLVRNDNSFLTRKANLKQVLAWKNGLFMFEDMTLAEILREISRWYDIDIDMRITPNEARYGGVIKRNSTLEKILVLLEQNGGAYHFKTEGRKVIVLP
jgi:ferric-dicitrate binding protein FerR (iron transport regulator)